MAFFISSNPVMTRANAKEVYRALEAVDFMAVADFFITPTAELADIVLPAATWLEMDYIGDFWKRHGYILPRRKVVQIGECRSDHDMLNDLAHRVGQGEHWWETFEGGLDYILEPLGMTWQGFKKMPYIRGEVAYEKYKTRGFSTPTKKFELYSTLLEVQRTRRKSLQYAGTLCRISVYPGDRGTLAGIFSHREPPAPLAQRIAT
jgi:anaerobic selenocysteine-containing dehydrogenase